MKQMLSVTGKELKAYFGSPMAAIFIGAFLLSALFSFFWIETFFARNIADIRPLFRWMPLLMIFLVAALTMRQWSEEQKMGTLEILLTLPVKLSHLVLGKFLAVLALVAISLILTLGLPVTVSFIGDMDWGPVLGGYLGALLMASAYISIGLFVSSRTDNQIIALIVTVFLAGLFYLVGSAGITAFMGNETGNFLRSLGTGSRFQSIERGVIDLRDLTYYASLTAFFLIVNIVSLDRKRWSKGESTASYRRNVILAAGLLGANLLAANIWMDSVHSLRLDLTEHKDYSISAPTKDLITSLAEPLTMTGYFSEKTHPLLAPLVPRIKDFLLEYEVASEGSIKVSFVDPKYDEKLEAEANQQYGIKPVPFQIAGRYEASVVNSYFHVLIKYGDQFVTLGFDDLIEIQRRKDGQLDVSLRNLEYDLTKSIKKVVYGFQSIATVFDKVNKELKLTAIITPDTLPEYLGSMPEFINKAASALVNESGGKLRFEMIDPDNNLKINRDTVNQLFTITPLASSFFSDDSFYLHLFLTVDEDSEQIYLANDLGEAEIRSEIEAALKRTSSGFLKTVGLWVPDPMAQEARMYQPQQQRGDYYQISRKILQENYNLKEVDLKEGRIEGDIDVLLLIAPHDMTELERFSVDQYLMRSIPVIALTGNYLLDISPYAQTLKMKQAKQGIHALLKHYGVTVDNSMVMDRRNEPFPVPVSRDLGGFVVREVRQLDYPFFVDVRSDSMGRQSPIVANLKAVTMNWVSPITVDITENGEKKIVNLLQSSKESWLHHGTEIMPDFTTFPDYGFPVGDSYEPHTLALSLQGSFSSFYAAKSDPRLEKEITVENLEEKDAGIKGEDNQDTDKNRQSAPLAPVIKKSPDSARLVVVGSSEFIHDAVIGISQSMFQDRIMNSLEFLQNMIDWSVEDESLLSIRSRGSHARILQPLSKQEHAFWEWLNYGLALAALGAVSLFGAQRRKKEKPLPMIELKTD